jgi:hypothetical protein
MLFARWMTLDAVGKIGDAVLDVFSLYLGRVVAAIASVRTEIACCGMARGARNRAAAPMVQREPMVKGCASPGGGGVALFAVRPELASMHGRFGMARDACLRRALEHPVDVAAGAGHVDVRARQLESGAVVIECGGLPTCRRVALRAVAPERAIVRVSLAMAVHTVLRRAFEITVGVAAGAGYVDVRAGQLERSLIVIEGGRLPRGR